MVVYCQIYQNGLKSIMSLKWPENLLKSDSCVAVV